MRALCLFGVLVVAKVLWLFSQPVALSVWAPVAYLSHDVVVAVLAWVIDRALREPRVGWLVYAAAVAYIAVNVPVTVVLGSPLTPAMLRAADGPLLDSVRHYATWDHLARGAIVAATGALLPRLCVRQTWSPILKGGLAVVVVSCVALGPVAAARLDTNGRDRNAFTSLLPLTLPVVPSPRNDWRVSPIPQPASSVDMSRFRGAARGMNILMVILESTAASYLKVYGSSEDPTPNLTRLAERALVFDDAYAVYPESVKGLLSTLCSIYPRFSESAEAQARLPCASLGQRLQSAGYRTGLFHSGRFMYLGMDAILRNKGFDVLEDAGAIGGDIHSSFGVDEPSAVRRVLEWIDAAPAGQPFFAAYLPIAGHHPYGSPEAGPFDGDDPFTQYQNALHYGDASLGRLLAGLRDRGLDENTVVIVFGDHGEAFGQHDGNIGHTLFIDDENVRVPYLIAIPGVTTASLRVTSVASLLDTAPTIVDLLGLSPDPAHAGTSLMAPGQRMALFFTDYSMGWLGLRDGCWKYQFETGSRRSRLFNVCHDAAERQDLSGHEPSRVQAYQTHLEGWAGTLRHRHE